MHKKEALKCIFITSISHVRRTSLTDKDTDTRTMAWVWPSVCGKWPHKSGGSPASAAVPGGAGGLRSHIPSWWLLAPLPPISSPTVLHFPSSSISIPPHPSLLLFLLPLCLTFLLPTHPLLSPIPASFHVSISLIKIHCGVSAVSCIYSSSCFPSDEMEQSMDAVLPVNQAPHGQ